MAKKIIKYFLPQFVLQLIVNGNERSVLLKKNIIVSFLFQALNIFLQFALVPIILNYLNPTRFGVWITLSSFVLWFSFFDLGLSISLKNKLSECIAKKEYNLARIYLSTTYALLIIIALILLIVFFVVNSFIDWSSVFNTSLEMRSELTELVLWTFIFFLLKFVFNIINVVFAANQQPSYTNYFSFLANSITFIAILIITKVTADSLFYVGLWISIPTFAVLFIASLYYYNKRFAHLAPSIKFIDFKKINPLLGLGMYFFISQMMALVIYSSDNMIILQVLGASQVTVYNIAFKYFSIVSMAFGIISLPLWSAFTHAFASEDYVWIRNTIKKFVKLWYMIIIGVFFMILFSNYIYELWVGKEVMIPILLTVFMGLYVIQNSWIIIYTYFIGGIAKMKLITIIHVIAGLANIPLSIFFAKHLSMGAYGVILATILCLLPQSILIPIQYKKIISKTAKGIWNK